MTWTFTIEGPFKPYVRMTQRSMHVDPQAQEYLRSKLAIGLQLKQQMDGKTMIPRQVPIGTIVEIEHARGFHNRDLDNELKAILDAAQGIVFCDDRWIDGAGAFRYRGDRDRITLTVWQLDQSLHEEVHDGCD